jgi:hypothetical protein
LAAIVAYIDGIGGSRDLSRVTSVATAMSVAMASKS